VAQVLGTVITRYDGRTVGHRELAQTIAMPDMPPFLGVVPLHLGMDAAEQISAAYEEITAKILEVINHD
jgi:hypothetical protein